MKTAQSKFVLPAFIAAIIATAFLFYSYSTHMNVAKAAIATFFPSTCFNTTSATSNLAFLTPGTGTTTVTCALGPEGAKSATLLLQVNASNTSAVTKLFAEESMDNQDFYPIAPQQEASTSLGFQADQRYFAQVTFASSTVGQGAAGVAANVNRIGASGTDNRNSYVINIPVRMRYVRVYAGNTGANEGLWMQILPREDTN